MMSAWSRFCSHLTPVGMTDRLEGDLFRKNLFSSLFIICSMGACRSILGDVPTVLGPVFVFRFTGVCSGDLIRISVPKKWAGFFLASVIMVFPSFSSSCRVFFSHSPVLSRISFASLIGPSIDIMKSSAYLTYRTLMYFSSYGSVLLIFVFDFLSSSLRAMFGRS